ncbi:neural Wiskott-Aldrich syndrome protein-like [Aricia agestis]|uniref:neural Wiskott-Aldrich syndrome protein-like n=1 Tax=Aricia agestis TaxID=91739 RepID=UPI001C2060A3|nr:neural Wiskott-Aldrich syndrome protein-like [Aricia agestis]
MPRGENKPSNLLSREENDQVFALIGPKCQSLATAVVQLFTTEGPGHSEWKKKDTGVLCLIKDNARRSYFFRIYCLYRKSMIWEHEVYNQIEYKSPRPYLHTFEAEEYMTAFNFANEDEATKLRNTLIEKIELRKQRREERRQRQSQQAGRTNSVSSYGSNTYARANGTPPPPAPPPPAPAPAVPLPNKTNVTSSYSFKSSNTGKKQKTRKLTKADIGVPQDFIHVSHVGWSANKGFDLENLPDEEMRSFFLRAGISDSQLADSATREFIYDFINRNGGINAVKEELHEAPKRKESQRVAAAPPVPARSPHPPAPPSRAPPPPPAPPARAVPPPPPPPAALQPPRNPPPPRPTQPPSSGPPSVPPPPPPGSAPPPPPPPPAPVAPAAPPAPPPPADDPRAALMESIRSGNKALRHVDVGSKTSLNDDSRGNLLSEIRQGISLRSVTTVTRSSSGTGESGGAACGLAGALAKALQERARAIQSSSDDDTETSDGEWED